MKCHRCGEETPRLTLAQRHCPACQRDLARIEASRRPARLPARDLTGWIRWAA